MKKKYIILTLLILIIPFTSERAIYGKELSTSQQDISITQKSSKKTTHKSIDKSTQKFLFGTWKVRRLLGFTKIQNDYANFPYGHDIIGNKIIINKKVFSTKSLKNAPRYQAKIKNPTYSNSYLYKKDDFLIFPVNPYAKNKEIDKIVNSDYFRTINIETNKSFAPVSLYISSNKKLILALDCVFYELKKEP